MRLQNPYLYKPGIRLCEGELYKAFRIHSSSYGIQDNETIYRGEYNVYQKKKKLTANFLPVEHYKMILVDISEDDQPQTST